MWIWSQLRSPMTSDLGVTSDGAARDAQMKLATLLGAILALALSVIDGPSASAEPPDLSPVDGIRVETGDGEIVVRWDAYDNGLDPDPYYYDYVVEYRQGKELLRGIFTGDRTWAKIGMLRNGVAYSVRVGVAYNWARFEQPDHLDRRTYDTSPMFVSYGGQAKLQPMPFGQEYYLRYGLSWRTFSEPLLASPRWIPGNPLVIHLRNEQLSCTIGAPVNVMAQTSGGEPPITWAANGQSVAVNDGVMELTCPESTIRQDEAEWWSASRSARLAITALDDDRNLAVTTLTLRTGRALPPPKQFNVRPLNHVAQVSWRSAISGQTNQAPLYLIRIRTPASKNWTYILRDSPTQSFCGAALGCGNNVWIFRDLDEGTIYELAVARIRSTDEAQAPEILDWSDPVFFETGVRPDDIAVDATGHAVTLTWLGPLRASLPERVQSGVFVPSCIRYRALVLAYTGRSNQYRMLGEGDWDPLVSRELVIGKLPTDTSLRVEVSGWCGEWEYWDRNERFDATFEVRTREEPTGG